MIHSLKILFLITLTLSLFNISLSANEYRANVKLDVSYANKGLKENIHQKEYTDLSKTALANKGYFSENGKYLLKINLKEISLPINKKHIKVTSVVEYRLIDTATNAQVSFTMISIPQRESNDTEIKYKDILKLATQKSLQRNMEKFIVMKLAPQKVAEERVSPEKNIEFLIGFGINSNKYWTSNTNSKDTSFNAKIGLVFDSQKRFYLNFEPKTDDDIDAYFYTLNFDYIFSEIRTSTIRPFIGANAGIVSFSNGYDKELLAGVKAGIISEFSDNFNLELGVSYSAFSINSISINKTQLNFGVNFQY